MSHRATAIYEDGVLRLLTPLALPEHTRVQVYVEPVSARHELAPQLRQVDEALLTASLIASSARTAPTTSPISSERREDLARRFSTGRPLSDLIAEDRDGR